MIGLVHYLTVAAVLFVIGVYGILTKRNVVAMLMSIELMLNAVNINLVAFSRFVTPELLTGQVFSLFTITVAATEVAVGLALVFRVYHDRNTVYADRLNWLRW
ncbi:NADH-quinone oxidoreductase subunit NuoK [bacterium BFN5]|nr:NADH-quinone oxidoreductase subunit NuoK [bacterium BFN5]QJW46999.1 NADH-quinone oxidoreductase subunit NuoK [bacterium BFN5]GBG58317.1 NADH-quinone oxidoreductase subunit K [Sporomusaceae bacterium FL31]GCE34228.1 NADH-quinone oxidoreductase subunit K [Sporomusaceae bacterium]